MKRHALALLAAACLSTISAATPAALQWRGISLAGAEFGEQHLPGEYREHYLYPSVESSAYFQQRGMNLMRLGFRWERLQPRLNAALDPTELARLRAFVDGVTARGLDVLLNPHNYARWHDHLVGSAELPHAAFADFWRRLALEFKDNPRVLFGLMNEPHSMRTETWVDAANAAIGAIRATGARNWISAPGNAWTGAWSWHKSHYGTPNAQAMLAVKDPAERLLIEVHQYLDHDHSGRHKECSGAAAGAERLAAFTQWARRHGKRALLGEIGAGNNWVCEQALRSALAHLQANADVWAGWAWWAGGPWWGNYFLSLEPYSDGREKPQWRWLRDYLRP